MQNPKRNNKNKAGSQHPNNPHRGRYDFVRLLGSNSELKKFIIPNPKGDNTIDFSDPEAVLCLNAALLSSYYNIKKWRIPEGFLCPPVPGRADYIHYAADLIAETAGENIPKGEKVKVLDIGTGAGCIYPIIGSQSYGWNFVATDIEPRAVKSSRWIVQSNPCLQDKVTVVQQKNKKHIFKGIINKEDSFRLTVCNPPFHPSRAKAENANKRKWKNLNIEQNAGKLNFGGRNSELWCPGGEFGFIKKMAEESREFAGQVCWFTSLVSNGNNVAPLKKLINNIGAVQIEVIEMNLGQKSSRIIAWCFMNKDKRIEL